MSSLNGDVAVARLDAAVEAFLDIMTAPEHTMVPVPEHEPQPSLAERARVNLKPATDEVARLAEEAAASAKAAQEAADKANQITGLSTVFDAIGLACVPMPDVWAPLTDSLRLFAGHGREVKVGSDVVASYLTFSRASGATYIGKDGLPKSAAVNEPRFEREGILIEGQSTNLVPNPSDLTKWASKVGYTVTHEAAEKAAKVVPLATGDAKAVVCKQGAVFPDKGSRPLTVTVDVKPAGFDMVVIGFKGESVDSPDNGIGVNINTGEVVRANHGLAISQVLRLVNGYTRISVSTGAYTDSNAICRDIVMGCGDTALPYAAFSAPGADGVKGIYVRFVQCEEGEYATSGIPVGSAPATRVADTLTLPTSLNFPGSHGDMTIAVEVRRNPALPPRYSQSIIHIGNNLSLSCTSSDFAAAGGSPHYARLLKPATGEPETVVFRIQGDKVSICCDGVISTVTRSGPLTSNDAITRLGAGINGFNCLSIHLRNLRGWQRALSDVQMKAIK